MFRGLVKYRAVHYGPSLDLFVIDMRSYRADNSANDQADRGLELDDTFGPQVLFVKAAEGGQVNLPPSAGLQFFGQVQIDGETEVMRVALRDLEGEALCTQELEQELS